MRRCRGGPPSLSRKRKKQVQQQVCFDREGDLRGMRRTLPQDHMDEQGKGEKNRVALHKQTGKWDEKLQGIPLRTGRRAEKCGIEATQNEAVRTRCCCSGH